MSEPPANDGDQPGLEVAAARIERRTRRVDPVRLLISLGCTAIGLGFGLLFSAWYGASHTFRVNEQIPYLISGGITGGVLVLLGGMFVATAVWVTLLDRTTARQREEQRAMAIAPSAPAPVPVLGFVATSAGKLYHRPDCPVVAGRDGVTTVTDLADRAPCRICEPEVALN